MSTNAVDTDLTRAVLEAVDASAPSEEFGAIPLPDTYLGVALHADEAETVGKLPRGEKKPSLAMHLEPVPMPELAPDEALIATMASSINYNTVWSAIFEPVPTFAFLSRYAKVRGTWGQRHDQPFHVVGSDASGVVLRVGSNVTKWKPGDRVVVHPNDVALEDPQGHDDTIRDPDQRVWGFESNYGGLGEICIAKGNQLMPKAEHLTWEEAASMPLVNCTAYRMLVGPNGANMQQGDIVLIWGAGGGLGGFATQYVLNGGGRPICVVSSDAKAAICRDMGAEWVIDRRALGFQFWDPETGRQNPREQMRLGKTIRELTGGRDVDIVFEHPGRDTFGASVFVTRRGGKVVTCASTSGFIHEFDNRYLWMFTKSIIGSHLANYAEAWRANELVRNARTHPIISRSYPLDMAGKAADDVYHNLHLGKVAVLCMSPDEGLGVRDPELRDQHVDAITRFRS
jgi:crotonyl-CoA reductase